MELIALLFFVGGIALIFVPLYYMDKICFYFKYLFASKAEKEANLLLSEYISEHKWTTILENVSLSGTEYSLFIMRLSNEVHLSLYRTEDGKRTEEWKFIQKVNLYDGTSEAEAKNIALEHIKIYFEYKRKGE